MGNPLNSTPLEKVKDLRRTDLVKPAVFQPDEWKENTVEHYKAYRTGAKLRATKGGIDPESNIQYASNFFNQFVSFEPIKYTNNATSIKFAIEGEPNNNNSGIRHALGKNQRRDNFDELYIKYTLKYYRSLYDAVAKDPKRQSQILVAFTNILDNESLKNISEVDKEIQALGYQFVLYDFKRKRDRREFTALKKIIDMHSGTMPTKLTDSPSSNDLNDSINYILYYLCEVDNPEQINIDEFDETEPQQAKLRQLVKDAIQYKHYDKIRKVYLLALREELLRIVSSTDTKLTTQKRALASQITNLLGISNHRILKLIEQNNTSILAAYIEQEFARYDITIPASQDDTQFDSKVNSLAIKLLIIWRELELSYPEASQMARDLAFNLSYSQDLTSKIHEDFEKLLEQMKQDRVPADESTQERIDQWISDITSLRSSIYKTHCKDFLDAYRALSIYLEDGIMPTEGKPSFIGLIELLDRYVDPKNRYAKEADGTYAAAAGLKPFLKKFKDAATNDLNGELLKIQTFNPATDYEKQIQVLTNFFDYVWQQLDLQQRYDLQDFDPSMPNQLLLNKTFVRDGKQKLNEFARQFGIPERGVKRNHPVEKVYLQINKLMTLLPASARKEFAAVRDKIIGSHNISTIRHLPMDKFINLEKADNPNKKENIHTLTELKRVMQAEIRYLSREERVQNNLTYLLNILATAAEISRPHLIVINENADLELRHIKLDLLRSNNIETQNLTKTDIDTKVNMLVAQNKRNVDVYFRDIQKLRSHVLAHLIAHNIPVASMNPLGDLDPVVSEYYRVDKRRTLTATKQAYRENKRFIAKISGPLALLFGLGQMITGIMGMAIFPQYMTLWLAYTLLAAGALATLRSNHNFVYSVNKTLLRRLYVFREFSLGYTSLSGKLFVSATYVAAFMFSVVFAVVVGTAFAPFAATTPLMLAALYAYKTFAALTIFVTLSNMTLFMAVAVSDTWKQIYDGLASLFPELGDANDKAAAFRKSLGFTGFVAGISRGIFRFITRDINIGNIQALSNRFGRYLSNPTQNPSASRVEKFYKHMENILLVPYTAGFFSLAAWLCYLSCVSTVAAWSGFFTGSLLAIGVPVAMTSVSVFVCVTLATNAVNTLFNVKAFSSQALNLSLLCSRLTVDITLKLPVVIGSASIYTMHQVLSGELFYSELFGEKGIISQAWTNPGKALYNFKIDLARFAGIAQKVLVEILTNVGNAISFSAPVAMKGLEDPRRSPKEVATDFTSNVSNSSAANAGGTLERYAGLAPSVIPQAYTVIGKYIGEKITNKIVLDKANHGSPDTSLPNDRIELKSDDKNYARFNKFFVYRTHKGVEDKIDIVYTDALRPTPMESKIDSNELYQQMTAPSA